MDPNLLQIIFSFFDTIQFYELCDFYNIKPNLKSYYKEMKYVSSFVCICNHKWNLQNNKLIDLVKYSHQRFVKNATHKIDICMNHAINCAIKFEQFEVVKYLREHGAKLTYVSMLNVCINGNLQIAIYLTENGERFTNDLLETAIEHNHVHIVRYIVETSKLNYNEISLISPCEKGHYNMVKYLLSVGIKKDADKGKKLAHRNEYFDIIDLFKKYKI